MIIDTILFLIKNIGASYGFLNFGTGNLMYTEIAYEYRKNNPVFEVTF